MAPPFGDYAASSPPQRRSNLAYYSSPTDWTPSTLVSLRHPVSTLSTTISPTPCSSSPCSLSLSPSSSPSAPLTTPKTLALAVKRARRAAPRSSARPTLGSFVRAFARHPIHISDRTTQLHAYRRHTRAPIARTNSIRDRSSARCRSNSLL